MTSHCDAARRSWLLAALGMAAGLRAQAQPVPTVAAAADLKFALEEVAAQFEAAFVHTGAGGRPHVDLKAALEAQLLEAGLAAEAIACSPFCTVTESARFFSHRASGGTTGRMMGAIGWTMRS